MKKADPTLVKLFLVRARSLLIPMTAAYYEGNIVIIMTERAWEFQSYIYDDFIDELQDIASEHNRHDAPIDLSSQCS